jgi:hypothetical protein
MVLRQGLKMKDGCRRHLGVHLDAPGIAKLRLDDRLAPRRDVQLRRDACPTEIHVANLAALESLAVAESSASGREPVSAARPAELLALPKQMKPTRRVACRLEFLRESWMPDAEPEPMVSQRLPAASR